MLVVVMVARSAARWAGKMDAWLVVVLVVWMDVMLVDEMVVLMVVNWVDKMDAWTVVVMVVRMDVMLVVVMVDWMVAYLVVWKVDPWVSRVVNLVDW